jgi:hypothetical protein
MYDVCTSTITSGVWDIRMSQVVHDASGYDAMYSLTMMYTRGSSQCVQYMCVYCTNECL